MEKFESLRSGFPLLSYCKGSFGGSPCWDINFPSVYGWFYWSYTPWKLFLFLFLLSDGAKKGWGDEIQGYNNTNNDSNIITDSNNS